MNSVVFLFKMKSDRLFFVVKIHNCSLQKYHHPSGYLKKKKYTTPILTELRKSSLCTCESDSVFCSFNQKEGLDSIFIYCCVFTAVTECVVFNQAKCFYYCMT